MALARGPNKFEKYGVFWELKICCKHLAILSRPSTKLHSEYFIINSKIIWCILGTENML